MLDVSIVIVNWNTRALLHKCLSSIFTNTRGITFDVWVVDNASMDGSAAMVAESFPNVRLVPNSVNLGFSAANNQAIRHSRSRYVCLLNPDTELVGNAIAKMVRFMDRQAGVGIAGCKLLNRDGSIQRSCHNSSSYVKSFTYVSGLDSLPFYKKTMESLRKILGRAAGRAMDIADYEKTQFPDWVLGACMLVRRTVLQEVGLLNEKFFMYFEDEDLCRRVRQGGWEVAYTPEATVTHYGGESTRQELGVMTVESCRSRLLFFKIYHGFRSTQKMKLAIYAGVFLRLMLWSIYALLRSQEAQKMVGTCWGIISATYKF